MFGRVDEVIKIQYFIHYFIQSFHSKIHSNFCSVKVSLSFPAHGSRIYFPKAQGQREDQSGSIQELHFQCMCVPQYILVMGLSVGYDRNKLQVKNLRL